MAKVDNSAWDASKAWSAGADSDDPAAFYKGICAGEKTDGDPGTQSHWALPHHYSPSDPPNAAGVRNGLSRLPQTDGLKNKSAAQSHLDGHMSVIQAEEKAATGRASTAEIAKARRAQREHGELPGGQLRSRAFPGRVHARLEQRDGRQVYHVSGTATVFNRGYEMWDMFGSYTEVVDANALDRSLAAGPDVAFLVNHRGVTMARSTNGTLEMSKGPTSDGYTGLNIDAYLNPDRQDVRDLMSAIGDGLIDEMSFAFMLNDGEWNDDYTQFRITEADINRGDVSAVNYGANPFTTIQARTADILADLERIPSSALGRAQTIVAERFVSNYQRAAADLSDAARARYIRAAADLTNIVRLGDSTGTTEVPETEVEPGEGDVTTSPELMRHRLSRLDAKEEPADPPLILNNGDGKSLRLWKARMQALRDAS